MTQDEVAKLVTALFESWYSSLVRYVYRATHNLQFAEDIAQETFFQLYRELRRGNKVDNPKGWTLCVARREMIRQRRPHTYEGTRHEALDVLETLPAGRVRWEDPISAWDEVAKLVSVLTKREEEVLLLRVEALKHREIASQLGISTKSVSTLIARALRKMRKATRQEPPGEGMATEEDVENDLPKTLQ